MAANPADYTPAQLRAAWNVCRLRTWPPEFEQAMADPLRSRIVLLQAQRLARAVADAPAPRAPRWTGAQRQAWQARPPRPAPTDAYDHKRAAAGDRDDD